MDNERAAKPSRNQTGGIQNVNHWWQWLLKPENLSAVSTAVSALVALAAILFTAFEAHRQIGREREEKKPLLIVTHVFWTATNDGFEFRFTNLGPHPIFLAGIVHDEYGKGYQFGKPELLILSGTTEPYEMETGLILGSQRGEFRLIFQYGGTGIVYHRLAFPYTIEESVHEADGKPLLTLDIPLERRKLTTNIGNDYEVLKRNLLAKEVFKA